MPTMRFSGAYPNFMPAASDAYSALLARLPQYADEAMTRRSLAAQQEFASREEDIKAKKLALREAKLAPTRRARMEREARREAQTAKGEAQARERGDEYAYVQAATQRAGKYGGNMMDAARAARSGFKKMRLGVPGGY